MTSIFTKRKFVLEENNPLTIKKEESIKEKIKEDNNNEIEIIENKLLLNSNIQSNVVQNNLVSIPDFFI